MHNPNVETVAMSTSVTTCSSDFKPLARTMAGDASALIPHTNDFPQTRTETRGDFKKPQSRRNDHLAAALERNDAPLILPKLD